MLINDFNGSEECGRQALGSDVCRIQGLQEDHDFRMAHLPAQSHTQIWHIINDIKMKKYIC